jgi:hypothetical protein
MLNATDDGLQEEIGGPEIPQSQVYCAVIVIVMSLSSATILHNCKFDDATFTKYGLPCEMISLSIEVLLCGYLISVGEANPNEFSQVLALLSVGAVFMGQVSRFHLLRPKVSSFIKLHLILNILMVPLCFYLIVISFEAPLPDETHMLVLVIGLSARLFINMFIIVGYYYIEPLEDEEMKSARMKKLSLNNNETIDEIEEAMVVGSFRGSSAAIIKTKSISSSGSSARNTMDSEKETEVTDFDDERPSLLIVNS